MERFNGILVHKSGPANKQHTSQSAYVKFVPSVTFIYLQSQYIT